LGTGEKFSRCGNEPPWEIAQLNPITAVEQAETQGRAMFKTATSAIPALIAAAAIAGALTVLPGASQSVSASSPLNSGKSDKSDRLDARVDTPNCAEQTWPYYDANCVKGRSPAAASGRSVRIVTTDRVTTSLDR
jgi:hypothetical protein